MVENDRRTSVEIVYKLFKSDLCLHLLEGWRHRHLTLYADDVLLLKKYLKVFRRTKKKLMSRLSMMDMQHVVSAQDRCYP